MPVFQFLTYIDVKAKDYDSAIEAFDHNLKYGNINRSDVYVADIEEKI
jgi:hypothetical protein